MDVATAAALVALAEDTRDRLRRQEPGARDRLEERYPEVRDALTWYVEQGDLDAACRLASALVTFWIASRRIDDADAFFAEILREPIGSEATRARALHDHGYLVFWAGRDELAHSRFTQSCELASSIGDRSVEALALAGLARVALRDDVDQALALLRAALTATDGSDDADPGRSSAMHVLGVALQMSGDLEGAREVMTRRLASGSERGDEFVVWVESANLAMVERQLGNLDRADELGRQALTIVARRRDEMSTAWTINGLAAVAAAQGRLVRAATLNAIAAALLARAGGEWPPDERQQFDETVAAVTAGLTPGELERARSSGAGLALDEAIAYALSP